MFNPRLAKKLPAAPGPDLLRLAVVAALTTRETPPEIAGHSDIKITMMVYAHGRLDEKAAALAQLGTALTGALPSAVAVTEPVDDRDEH